MTPITKDELRERLDILEIIGQYVRLQRAGTEWRGLCPFHEEKTPSFYVNPTKGLWYCRGACGEGGDVFKFVQKAENLEFGEVLELLATRLGYTLQRSEREVRAAGQRQRLQHLLTQVAGLYEKALWSESGRPARDYLARRGLSEEVARRFRLGYAPAGWDKLTRHLERAGLSLEDADRAGLIKRRENGEGYYDRFRQRLMFPILDAQGRCVGFGGRVLDPEDEPKYLNSPESPIFQKRSLLYGLPFAVGGLAEGAVVVEGYMDVIALHEQGLTRAVATLGTSLTTEHLRLLRRHTNRIVLCYDADTAGQRATDRAAAMFVDAGLEGRVLLLPEGKDPDEFIRTYGRPAFEELLAATPEVVDYRLQTALHQAGDDPARQQEVIRETVTAILGDITDEVRQADYVRRIAEWWSGRAVGLQEELERTLLRSLRGRRRRSAEPVAPPRRTRDRAELVERALIGLLLRQPALVAQVGEQLTVEDFVDEGCREIYAALLAGAPAVEERQLLAGLDEAGQALAAELLCGEPAADGSWRQLVDELRCRGMEARVEQLRREAERLDERDHDAQAEIYGAILAAERNLRQARDNLLQYGGGG